jgi:hypothetical protein
MTRTRILVESRIENYFDRCSIAYVELVIERALSRWLASLFVKSTISAL